MLAHTGCDKSAHIWEKVGDLLALAEATFATVIPRGEAVLSELVTCSGGERSLAVQGWLKISYMTSGFLLDCHCCAVNKLRQSRRFGLVIRSDQIRTFKRTACAGCKAVMAASWSDSYNHLMTAPTCRTSNRA